MLMNMDRDYFYKCRSLLQSCNPKGIQQNRQGIRVGGEISKTVISSWWSTMEELSVKEREREKL